MEWLYGPALLVRREAVDAVGPVRRGLLHVQRGGRLADALPPGRLEGAVLPGSGGRPRRRRDARRPPVRREPARPPPLVRSTRARSRPSACGCCSLWSLRLRALVLRRGRRSRGDCVPLVRRRPDAAPSDRVPPPRVRHGGRARCRAPPSRAPLGRRSASAALAWTLASLFVAWAVVFTVHSNIRLACCVLAVIFVGATLVRRRRPRERSSNGERSRRGALFAGVVLGWLLWHVDGRCRRRRALPRGARAQARRPRRPAPAHGRRVQGRRSASRLRVPALARLRRGGRVGLGPRSRTSSCATSRRCSPRSRASSPGRPASRSSTPRCAALAVLVASLAIFCFGPGHGGSFATLALPGTAARQLLVPAAIALFFTAAACWQRRRSSARSLLCIRRTRCSC